MFKCVIVLVAVCAIFAPLSLVWGASDGAMKLRAVNGLSEFKPPEAFLNGNFMPPQLPIQPLIFGLPFTHQA